MHGCALSPGKTGEQVQDQIGKGPQRPTLDQLDELLEAGVISRQVRRRLALIAERSTPEQSRQATLRALPVTTPVQPRSIEQNAAQDAKDRARMEAEQVRVVRAPVKPRYRSRERRPTRLVRRSRSSSSTSSQDPGDGDGPGDEPPAEPPAAPPDSGWSHVRWPSFDALDGLVRGNRGLSS